MELSQRGGYVVATGGGALTFQRNVDAFKEGGVIVLLDTPLRVLQLRLKTTGTGLCSSGRTVSGLSGSFTKSGCPSIGGPPM